MTLNFDSFSIEEPSYSSSSANRSPRRPNPFKITREMLDYDYNTMEENRVKTAKKTYLKQSLTRRSAELSPLPPFQQIPVTHSSPTPKYANQKKKRVFDKNNYRRPLLVAEKKEVERDLYTIQMILDKKNQNITEIERTMNEESKNLDERDNQIQDESHELVQRAGQIESMLQQARKAAEQAARERVAQSKVNAAKEQTLNQIQSEIETNICTLELYQRYKNFITSISKESDEGCKDVDFPDPDFLSKTLDHLERENIFADSSKDHLEDLQTNRGKDIGQQLRDVENDIEMIDNQLSKIPNIQPLKYGNEQNESDSEDVMQNQIDDELQNEIDYLSDLVLSLYYYCFGKKVILTPVEMLERIEDEMEKLYQESELCSPEFLEQKQNVIDKERRAENRIKQKIEHERLIQEKRDAAVARANRPVKVRKGRKLMERMVHHLLPKKTKEQVLESEKEKERLENLLFGEIDADII